MRKILLLTITLIMGINLTSKANNIESFKTSVNDTSKKLTELIELCRDIEDKFDVRLGCEEHGKTELRKILVDAIENEKERILRESEEKVREEKLTMMADFVRKMNLSIVSFDYIDVCEQVKKTFPDCKDMPEDCEEPEPSEIYAKTTSCFASDNSLNDCEKSFNLIYIEQDEEINNLPVSGRFEVIFNKLDYSGYNGEFINIYVNSITKKAYIPCIDCSYNSFLTKVRVSEEQKRKLTKGWFENCMYKLYDNNLKNI